MADIGSILLPDPNLMAGYQQSFDKQMALKQYVAQDSRQQEQQFAKESYFMPDADLAAYKGQSAAMALNVQKYMQHRQELSADRSRGGFFGLDPKAQAELAAEKYSLMQDQATRLNAITKLTSALPIIRKAGFGGLYDEEYTQNWMKQLNEGKVPEGEPIQELPQSMSTYIKDKIAKIKGDRVTVDSTPTGIGGGNTQKTITTYYTGLGSEKSIANNDKKAYIQDGLNKYSIEYDKDPAEQHIAANNYQRAITNDPYLIQKYKNEPNPVKAYYMDVNNDLLKGEMGGGSSIDRTHKDPPQGAEKKTVTPDGNIADFSGYSIKLKLPDKSDATGRQQNDVSVGTWSLDGKKATVYKTARTFDQKTQMWSSETTEEVVTDPTELHKIKNAIDNSHVAINGNFTAPTNKGKGQRIGKITGSN